MPDTLMLVTVALAVLTTGFSLLNWRYCVYGLLLFMPFVGIPTIILYPAPPMTRLIKDIIFVIPAYMGFAAWYLSRRLRERMPQPVVWLGVVLAGLVLLHMFNPTVPDSMVALVGLKTWVLYLPLMALGYHLVGTVSDLDRLVRRILLVSVIPIALGVTQAVLVYAGEPELAYRPYGQAAFDVTQGFGRTEVGTGDVARVASTFTFVSQYYNYVLATLCLAYGRWRSLPARSAARFWRGMVPLAFVVLAGFLTGARGAFVMIPLFFILALCLSANWLGLIQVTVLLVAGLWTALGLFNTTWQSLFALVRELSVGYLTVTQIGEFNRALSTTFWGMGTGINTGPARFVFPDPTTSLLENYYAKAVVELGVPGLIALVLLFVTIATLGYLGTRTLENPIAKAHANSFLAFVIISAVNGWKGSYLDLDPLNVYFWLYTGLLLRIPKLSSGSMHVGASPRSIPATTRQIWTMPAIPSAGSQR